jgi:hypothetical protein
MTEEELTKFALVLRECDRICVMIAEEAGTADADDCGELPLLSALPAVEQSSGSAAATAA